MFLGGIALLAFTFVLAIRMFSVEPNALLNIGPGQPLDLNRAGATLIAVIVRILLLLVMAVVGGLIANRGVHMYADSRHAAKSAARDA